MKRNFGIAMAFILQILRLASMLTVDCAFSLFAVLLFHFTTNELESLTSSLKPKHKESGKTILLSKFCLNH